MKWNPFFKGLNCLTLLLVKLSSFVWLKRYNSQVEMSLSHSHRVVSRPALLVAAAEPQRQIRADARDEPRRGRQQWRWRQGGCSWAGGVDGGGDGCKEIGHEEERILAFLPKVFALFDFGDFLKRPSDAGFVMFSQKTGGFFKIPRNWLTAPSCWNAFVELQAIHSRRWTHLRLFGAVRLVAS